jgi:hypothetical protein
MGMTLVENNGMQVLVFLYIDTPQSHRTLVLDKSFIVFACREWNFLTQDMKLLLFLGLFITTLRRMYRDVRLFFSRELLKIKL